MDTSRSAATSNNFGMIRLLAAIEVAVVHAMVTLRLGDDSAALHIIPGVPTFFLVSGYLIFPSFAASRNLAHYARKRAFRIYPALYVCFAVCVVTLLLIGQLDDASGGQLSLWALAQLSIAQFYNPSFLRDFGTGSLNGSLWTVSVELQFYMITPLLAWLLLRWKWLWFPLIALFALANVAFAALDQESALGKLAMVTFAPWLYMFLVGAWLSTRADVTAVIRRVSPVFFIAVFALCAAATWAAGLPLGTNSINPLMFTAMAALIIRLAYAKPELSGILRGVDVSYGIYIYHMPVFNLLLWVGLAGSFAAGAFGFVVVICLAAASWFAIERPALSFVHRTQTREKINLKAGTRREG